MVKKVNEKTEVCCLLTRFDLSLTTKSRNGFNLARSIYSPQVNSCNATIYVTSSSSLYWQGQYSPQDRHHHLIVPLMYHC